MGNSSSDRPKTLLVKVIRLRRIVQGHHERGPHLLGLEKMLGPEGDETSEMFTINDIPLDPLGIIYQRVYTIIIQYHTITYRYLQVILMIYPLVMTNIPIEHDH